MIEVTEVRWLNYEKDYTIVLINPIHVISISPMFSKDGKDWWVDCWKINCTGGFSYVVSEKDMRKF